jgi:hypothetical protein
MHTWTSSQKQQEDYYFKRWPRERIPAFSGLTPLQAAKTEKGREKLKKLLDNYDRWQDADDERGYRIDFDELRRMLGLPRGPAEAEPDQIKPEKYVC